MKIGEAAEASGASPRALRLYEDQGLILPGRLSNGYRDYCSGTIDRVRTVRRLLQAGLPVRLVKEVLPTVLAGRSLDPQTYDEVQRYHDRLIDRILQLDQRRTSLAMFLAQADAPKD